jgi:hypothetical protein
MRAPRTVEPVAWPMTPPRTAPPPAPITAPFSCLPQLAQPPAATARAATTLQVRNDRLCRFMSDLTCTLAEAIGVPGRLGPRVRGHTDARSSTTAASAAVTVARAS